MPITNPIKRKEYARLSMAIKKARERGENINQLLEQRKSLTQQGINEPGIKDKQFIPRKKYKQPTNKISFETLLNEIRKTQELLKQEKLERILFHYEISEMVREWQQGISEIKQTVKELISQKQSPIVRTSREKKTEPNTRERKRKSLLPPSGLKYKSPEW
ncbi:22483_t:CDS:1 [Racocetra persica]|uniref:22483_t:CDS:1 n=1 Tax=Racocetra persica TaxID=160502 RepID=A0ACA9MQT4_9GLOM|nr:22483_t:CDS:1 [Racocetra persica]